MNLRSYLHELRKIDHLISSLPSGPVRRKIQVIISNELDRLLQLQRVESTKGHARAYPAPEEAYCAEDAEAPPDPWGG